MLVIRIQFYRSCLYQVFTTVYLSVIEKDFLNLILVLTNI